MIKNSQKQSGSAHVVIIIALVIGLIGALSFIFYQNIVKKESVQKSVATDVTVPDKGPDLPEDSQNAYTNNEDDYSIQHPPTYKILEKQEAGGLVVYIADKDLSDQEIYSRQDYKMRISVSPDSAGAVLLPQGDVGPGYREVKGYKVDGILGQQGFYPAIVNEQISQTETESITTAFKYNGKIYRFESGGASMGNFDANDYNSMIESVSLL